MGSDTLSCCDTVTFWTLESNHVALVLPMYSKSFKRGEVGSSSYAPTNCAAEVLIATFTPVRLTISISKGNHPAIIAVERDVIECLFHESVKVWRQSERVALTAWTACLILHKFRLPRRDAITAEKIAALLALSWVFYNLRTDFTNENLIKIAICTLQWC